MVTRKRRYPYRYRPPEPQPMGPPAEFVITGVMPVDTLHPVIESVCWRQGVLSSVNAHLIADVIAVSRRMSLDLNAADDARAAITATLLERTVRVTPDW